MPLQFRLRQGSSRDSAGEAHTASGALAFGSPNFKMLPEPLAAGLSQQQVQKWLGVIMSAKLCDNWRKTVMNPVQSVEKVTALH